MDYRTVASGQYRDILVEFLKEFEGYGGGIPYRDASARTLPTIGYGTRIDIERGGYQNGVDDTNLIFTFEVMGVNADAPLYDEFFEALALAILNPGNLVGNIESVWDDPAYLHLHPDRPDFTLSKQEAGIFCTNPVRD